MPKKGNHRRITSKTPYDKVKRLQKKENTRERKSGEFRKRFSAKLRFALVFRSAFQFVLRRVLVWRSEATPLVIDKHTPWWQNNTASKISKLNKRIIHAIESTSQTIFTRAKSYTIL